MSTSFTHLVNPFAAKAGSEHDLAQRITFASMRRAVADAARAGIPVQVLAVVTPGDTACVEKPAEALPVLNRSVQNLREMKPRREFPLVADLLGAALEHGRGEHLVFTNVDISLQPHFYTHCAQMLATGIPAFIVNRRTIPSDLGDPARLEEMYACAGKPHPGYDCFVFPRRWVERMELGNACIGARWFDSLLAANLDVLSGGKSQVYRDLHLTFHIGDDRDWVSRIDYEEFNLAECLGAMRRLAPHASGATVRYAGIERTMRNDDRLLRRARRLMKRCDALVRAQRWLREQTPMGRWMGGYR